MEYLTPRNKYDYTRVTKHGWSKPSTCCENPLAVPEANDVPSLEIPLKRGSLSVLLLNTSPSQHRNALNPKEPKKKGEEGNKKHIRSR
jgi:hypothetical protein